jgi:hypothetical protein
LPHVAVGVFPRINVRRRRSAAVPP